MHFQLRNRRAGFFTAAMLVLASCFAAPLQAQGPAKTVAVVAIERYSDIISDIDFIGGLGGRAQLGRQGEAMASLFTGQALDGLDKSKPWGAVVQTDGFQFAPIICLPVTDLNKILDAVRAAEINVSEAGDGMMEIEAPQQSIYVKEVNGWAFITNMSEMIGSAPADPAKEFAGLTGDYDIGIQVLVQNVPEMYRDIAVTQMKAGMEQGLERNPSESDQEYALRKQMVEAQMQQMVQLIQELDKLTIGWKIDESAGDTYMDFAYAMVPGSELAEIANASETIPTKFAGFTDDDAAMSMRLSGKASAAALEKQRAQFEQIMGQVREQIDSELATADVPNEEVREVLKGVVSGLMDSAEETLMAGEYDMGASIKLSSDSASVIAGMGVKKSKNVEDALMKLQVLVADEPDAPTFEFNAETFQGVRMHNMSIDIPADEEPARKMFGDKLNVTFGISESAVYMAAGRDSASALKQAITDSASSSSTPETAFEMVMSLESIMKFAAEMDDSPQQPMLAMLAETMAANSDNANHVRITGETIENGEKYRLKIEAGVLSAIGDAAKAAMSNTAGPGGGGGGFGPGF